MNDFSWDPSQEDEDFGDRTVSEEAAPGQWQQKNASDVRPTIAPQSRQPAKQVAPPPVQAPVEEEVEVEEEEDDYSTVLSDARLRLEQGRLYEMLMNNSLFQDLDVDPKAVKFVEKKVKNFAKEQMEIMLGMRQEQQRVEGGAQFVSPFNDLEVEALKMVASSVSKGATQAPEAQTFTKSSPSPQAPPKRTSLTPIGGNTTKTKPAQAPKAKALPQTAPTPIKRNKQEQAIEERALAESGYSKEDAEFDRKPWKGVENMTEAEIAARNKEISQKRLPVKSSSALPMPSQEVINSMIETNVARDIKTSNLVSMILNSKK